MNHKEMCKFIHFLVIHELILKFQLIFKNLFNAKYKQNQFCTNYIWQINSEITRDEDKYH